MKQLFPRLGPGLLVTAAFIGPGTVTTATLAGAKFGYALLWVLLFSIIATIVLQEMSARLGLVTRHGLGEALRNTFPQPAVRAIAIVLVVSAVGLGNAAFQTGNFTGASMGLDEIVGGGRRLWSVVVGAAAFAMLWTGRYKWIERVLIALVVVMSVVFLLTAVAAKPSITALANGLVRPRMPDASLTTIIALIGTTVVPYNLFLHASAVREKWSGDVPLNVALRDARADTVLSVSLGGLVTLAIVVTAAASLQGVSTIDNAAAMAAQLEPILGPAAKWFFAIGLFAAGMTSAITAPLAAAYATCGAVGLPPDLRSTPFRAIWALIVVAGLSAALVAGKSPVAAIVFAQAANGIILPIMAVFLLVAVNQSRLMREYGNGAFANLLGVVVVLIAAALGAYNLWTA